MRRAVGAGVCALALSAAAAQGAGETAGQAAFRGCQPCHALAAGQQGIGPSLHRIVGRNAGTQAGFRYSNVLTKSDIVWTRRDLTEFLRDPQARLPGNRMTFPGLDDDAEIEALIDYLNNH